jgi:hypothetical protein
MGMHRQSWFRLAPLLICSCLGALLFLPAAEAEMLQFSTPDGVKSWPKLPDITDWHQDQDSSLKLTANSLIPDGVDPTNAEVSIQARGFARRGDSGTTSLSQLMDKDRALALPGTKIEKRPDIFDKDGVPFTVISFLPAGQEGQWKAVAYSEEGDYLLAFTLLARSQAAYDRNYAVFSGLIQKYAKDIPW